MTVPRTLTCTRCGRPDTIIELPDQHLDPATFVCHRPDECRRYADERDGEPSEDGEWAAGEPVPFGVIPFMPRRAE